MKVNIYKLLLYFVTFLIIFPIFYLFLQGVSKPILWPNVFNNLTFDNIAQVLSFRNNKILLNSVFLSYLVSILTILISIPAAYALVFYKIRLKFVFYALLLLPIVMPITAVAIGSHMSFLYLHIANSVLGIVLIHILPGLPYVIVLFVNYFKNNNFYYQNLIAHNLEATKLHAIIHVGIPMLYPVLYVAFILSYVISFGQYFITFLIGGGSVVTYSMLIFPIVVNNNRGLAGAFVLTYILSVVLVIIITDFIFKAIYKFCFNYHLKK